MIIFGSSKTIALNDKVVNAIDNNKMKIFNLSTMSEKGENLFSLLPPFEVEMYDPEQEKEFDIAYCNYILENDVAFIDLMKIIYFEYENGSEDAIIYVMVDSDDIRTTITESLIKFIQQRYGINAALINEIEDWDYIESSTFTVTGLYNLDSDKERYANLTNE